jgi:Leucine-rich repeat (LRR) protein
MATLVSPGVSVQIVDESQNVAATQGTLPLLVVATAANKTDASGSRIAAGTLPANAGVAFLVSSQRELVETFGQPYFYEVGGSVVQGAETSEYGLLAAYQYLGVANNAYVIRADVDLAQLEATTVEPAGAIVDGTYWHNVNKSIFGLHEWDGTQWVPAWLSDSLTVLVDEPGTGNVEAIDADGYASPKNTYGSIGDFAVVASTTKITYWKKVGTNWVLLGNIGAPNFQFSKFAPTTNSAGDPLVVGDTYIRLATQNGGLDIDLSVYNSASGLWTAVQVPAYTSTDAANADLIDEGDVFALTGGVASIELKRHTGATSTTLLSNNISDTANITAIFEVEGVSFNFSGSSLDQVITQLQGNSDLNNANVKVEKVGSNKIRFTRTDGMDLNINFTSGYAALGFAESTLVASVWEDLVYEASTTAPKGPVAEGTLWFNADLKIEILRNEWNGATMEWTKYAWSEDTIGLGQAELQLRSSAPAKRKDGTSSLVVGDIWVDGDAKPYPAIYRWSGSEWVKLDGADQSSTNGVIFSHYSDVAPWDEDGLTNTREAHASTANPELLPENILMVNMDYSTYNVKRYTNGAWEWASGVNTDGSGKFGSDAQRHMVVEAMQAALAGNEGIRAEATYFSLIAAPGYPELMDEMISLNKDKKEIAFVIGDAPLTLKSDTTSIKNWADDNLPADAYAGVYYPHGLSTDLSGNDVVMPASAIALRTMAFSDQVSYPWFAPAGLTRGVVTNASAVGYVNAENEFVRVRLSEGQRDIMYLNRMNPIADLPNTGLVVYGQKTLQGFSSAMDRVNVARLVNYMRYNLDLLSRGFLFEQNDKITRDNMRDAVERFCGGLVSTRGLYDFLVVCDETNNTPARIDRNELWVDVAIQPVKSVEFIYIPLRIRNTGETL